MVSRKKLVFLVGLLFLFIYVFSSVKSLRAENPDSVLSKEYQVFLSRLTDINEHQKFYLSLINQFRGKTGSLNETNILSALKDLQTSRGLALESYFSFLRSELAKTTKIIEYQENLAYIYLDNYQTEAKKFAREIGELSKIEEIKERSLRFKESYRSGEKLAFRTIGLINYKKLDDFLSSFQSLLANENFTGQESILTSLNTIKKELQAQNRIFLSTVEKSPDSLLELREYNRFLTLKKNDLALLLVKSLNSINSN